MKTIKHGIIAAVILLVAGLRGQAQTNTLKFIATKTTDEKAIQLRWQSKTNGVYRIDYTPQLSGNIVWDTLVDFFHLKARTPFF